MYGNLIYLYLNLLHPLFLFPMLIHDKLRCTVDSDVLYSYCLQLILIVIPFTVKEDKCSNEGVCQ